MLSSLIISGDHVECVSVDYDMNKISYKELLNIFWNNHEYGLTTRVKRQYMSLILYHNEKQRMEALESLEEEKIRRSSEVIITEIAAAGSFYPAEEYLKILGFRSIIFAINLFSANSSYHQKFRLQAHKDFVKTLELNSELLLKSFIAARLNGYLVGVGGMSQFQMEICDLGLNQSQVEYVKHFIKKYEGGGLLC